MEGTARRRSPIAYTTAGELSSSRCTDRVTYEITLSPFTLRECEEFYQSRNVRLSRYDIAQSYMVFGGIPYYMGYGEPGMSLAQGMDSVFFGRNAVFFSNLPVRTWTRAPPSDPDGATRGMPSTSCSKRPAAAPITSTTACAPSYPIAGRGRRRAARLRTAAADARSKLLDMLCQSGVESPEWWWDVLVGEGDPLYRELEAI